MMILPGNGPIPMMIPAHVMAAQQFLHFMETIRTGGFHKSEQESYVDHSRQLTPMEQQTYNSAMMLLKNYFEDDHKSVMTFQQFVPPNDHDDSPTPAPCPTER